MNREFANYLRDILDAMQKAQKFIEKSHHIDGCQKARENWKECTCGKEYCLDLLYECFEFHVREEGE